MSEPAPARTVRLGATWEVAMRLRAVVGARSVAALVRAALDTLAADTPEGERWRAEVRQRVMGG